MNIPVEISDARRIVFGGLIDYAGLFPPASLDMTGAVAGYRASRSSPNSWMVDRFIVGASRLEELAGHLTTSMSAGEEPWRLSVLADLGGWPNFEETVHRVTEFADELGPSAPVELIEARMPEDASAIEAGDCAVAFARRDAVTFFEMPPNDLPLDVLVEARRHRDLTLGAKLRCGGVTADLFPSPERVAQFIHRSTQLALPFKCTAGLHHPVRHVAPETGFTHHGFLNILAASLAAADGAADVTEIVADTDPGSFSVGRSGFKWRDRSFGADIVSTVRAGGFIGYGSCDFEEPVADLTELAMLP